ncbi:unnamed protein product [Leptosia nina]|uniref:RanBP2-type domain-containing protein n=1 Tax=Leptosia nina TaxID=320188 RepID=A0AAV1K4F7_9NEOP
MSVPSDSATTPSPCACTNISLMQLFHELKQKFPGIPDHVVSNTIELYCHDKKACETHLHREVKTSLTHAYHASSLAAARQLNELKINPPQKCRNQPIVKHEALKSLNVQSVTCQAPQKALINTNTSLDEDTNINTDANQNVVGLKQNAPTCSPVTIVNLDNCFVKYSAESPSDLELTNDNKTNEDGVANTAPECEKQIISDQPGSTNFKLLKSNKIRSNLNEKLESGKGKKSIKKEKEEQKPETVEPKPEKPQRPNTLNFIKPAPDIAFSENINPENYQTVSPTPPVEKIDKESKSSPYKQERGGYPLNLSVNVNCHMDLSRGYESWLDYESPRAITSVNLTVCTPTSNMASPVRENNEDGGFEGHVTVTVSPSTTRPKRRAPPPPQTSHIDSPRPTRAAPEPPNTDRSLIERQKERLSRLAAALAQEKGRLAQLNRETQILAAPTPSALTSARLRDHVERLRDECDMLAKRLELGSRAPRVLPVPEIDDAGNFYSNIYTGQRPSASWQCHMCTFRNHPLLDKCEECDMPRIFVVRSPDGITVRLMPGRRKIVRSWVL